MNIAEFEKAINNETTTHEGGFAYKSTGSTCLDLFDKAPNFRYVKNNFYSDSVSPQEMKKLIVASSKEDLKLTTEIIGYVIDRFKGTGNRDFLRLVLKEFPFLELNMKTIPLIRLDMILKSTRKYDNRLGDILNEYTQVGLESLFYKWMPSINASNRDTVKVARILRDSIGMRSNEYRQWLSSNRTNIIEKDLSQKRELNDLSKYSRKSVFGKLSSLEENHYGKIIALHNDIISGDYDIGSLGFADIVNSKNTFTGNVISQKIFDEFETPFKDEKILPVLDVSYSMPGFSLGTMLIEKIALENEGKYVAFGSDVEIRTADKSIKSQRNRGYSISGTNFDNMIQYVDRMLASDSFDTVIIVTDAQFGYGHSYVNTYGKLAEKYDVKIIEWNIEDYDNTQVQSNNENVVMLRGDNENILSIYKEQMNEKLTAEESMKKMVKGYDKYFTL